MKHIFFFLTTALVVIFVRQILIDNKHATSFFIQESFEFRGELFSDLSDLAVFGNSADQETYLHEIKGNSISNLPNQLDLQYFGKWLSDDSKIANFSGNNGNARFLINRKNKTLAMLFIDGAYIDQQKLLVTIDIPNVQYNSTNFTNDSARIQAKFIENFRVQYTKEGRVQFNLTLFDGVNGGPLNKNDITNATLFINSTDLGLNANATFSTSSENIQSRAMNYSILVTFLCCLHLYACIQLIKYFAEYENEANKVSLLTIGFFTCWDLLLCLFHLYEGLTSNQYFHFFITPAFWYFILSSIFETRLLLIVWRIRYIDNLTNPQELRRGIFIFYLKFYGGLIFVILLANYFLYMSWFLAVCACFFVPQIAHSAIKGQRMSLNPYYVLGFGLSRGIIPLYVKGCSANVFELTPSLPFCIVMGSLFGVQVLIMYLQSKFGSRFFVPAFLLPPKYNYFIKESINQTPQPENNDCAICMENLHQEPSDQEAPLLGQKSQSSYIVLMQTPCRHKFHKKCLMNWMNIKLECPLCKSSIPPLD